jgi:hypothetical protein
MFCYKVTEDRAGVYIAVMSRRADVARTCKLLNINNLRQRSNGQDSAQREKCLLWFNIIYRVTKV